MFTFRRSARTVIALGAGLALTLAACGGGDDDDATTTTDAAVPEVSPSVLTLGDQDGDGTMVSVDRVELPSPGFIAVHADGGGSPGDVIGVSDLLPAGETDDVVVPLDDPLAGTATVYPMVHIDTNDNGIYEFDGVNGVDGPGITADGEVAVGPLTITTESDTVDTGTSETETSGTDDAASDAPTGDVITISDFSFSGVTEVAVGTTVVVTNTDAAPHTWSAEDGTFDSGALATGETFEFTFTEAGEFAYFCNFHPSMTGTIVVTG